MEKQFDVVALGELLIDFTKNGVSNQGNGLFEACPGGAPCNVLAMLRKLNKSCAFVGKVGDDMFGSLLQHTILDAGINAEHLILDCRKAVGRKLADFRKQPVKVAGAHFPQEPDHAAEMVFFIRKVSTPSLSVHVILSAISSG